MKNVILTLSVFFLVISVLPAQKAPIKFGEVSPDELKMVSYPGDTSAAAVILCDYGYLNIQTALFTRTLRIKILKKEGYNWANHSYPSTETSTIKGITTNLENDKVVQEKLKNESIFYDKLSEKNFVVRAAMPNIKVGSVIDLQFAFKGIPSEWKFQEVIPVKYSELILENPKDVRFRINYFGFEPLAVSTPPIWIAKEMPSFKIESYMSSKENYLTKFEFDILNITYGAFTKEFASSWESVSRLLLDNSNFISPNSGSIYLNNLAKSIENSKTTGEEKLKMAYESVKSIVKWDERKSVVASSPNFAFTFKMKLGNSADVNLILYQLLKKLDFDVTPVVMSTRDNGILSPISPSLSKLNYVIVLAKIGDKSILLDATEPYMPYYLIPLRCLNNSGRTVSEVKSDLVDLSTTRKDKEFTTYFLKIQEDNTLRGKLSKRKIDYSALDFRSKYHKFNSQDAYLEDFKKDKLGLVINESRIDNVDSVYLPVIEEYDVTLNNLLNVLGNEVYIMPLLYDQLKENPFALDVRKYPVDYGYNIEKNTTSSFEIPDNYTVTELPGSVRLRMEGNSASLIYDVSQLGNTIKVTSIFAINKTMFLPEEYAALKEFYNQVIKKQSEPIILKKK